MAEFFKTSKVWVVDFVYDGRSRKWLKALPIAEDARHAMECTLHDLYGNRARLLAVREATEIEELDYLRGNGPANAFCSNER